MRKSLQILSFLLLTLAGSSSSFGQFITTSAGTGIAGYSGDGGAASLAQLSNASSVIYDAAGNAYVTDRGNNRIRKIDASGNISTVAGTGVSGYSGDGGLATAAALNSPSSVFVVGNSLFFSDAGNNCVRKVNLTSGIITTVAGTGISGYAGDGGAATSALLNNPTGIYVDATENIYIADAANNVIRFVDATSGTIVTVAGVGTAGFSGDGNIATLAELNNPTGVWSNGELLYIVDKDNNRVRMVDITGTIQTIVGDGTTTYAGDGVTPTATGLSAPYAMTADAASNLYISVSGDGRVIKVDGTSNTISTVAGVGTSGYNGDCTTPASAELNNPTYAILNNEGNLAIADAGNNRIRVIVPPCSGTPSPGYISSTAMDGCISYSATLTLNEASKGCDITYQWQSSTDGVTYTAITGATNTTYNTGALTSSTYFNCVVTCTSSSTFFTGSSIFLHVAEPAVLAPITGLTSVCNGATIGLSNDSTGGTWSVFNANASVSSSGIVTGLNPGTDTVYYSITNLCGTTRVSYPITINPVLTPAVSISTSSTGVVCQGSSVMYTANPTNGGTAPSYTWMVNGDGMDMGSTFSYTPVNGDTISVTLSSSEICVSTTVATTDLIAVVTNTLTPTINISSAPWGDSVCVGTSVTYSTATTGAGSSPSYNWTVNGVIVGSSSTLTYTPSNNDTIICQLTSSYACPNPAVVSSNMKVITVDISQTPIVNITSDASDTLCAGVPVTFSASGIYAGATPTYVWEKNGVNVATGVHYTYIPTNGDSVSCKLFSSVSCRSADSVYSTAIHMNVTPSTLTSVSLNVLPGTAIDSGDMVLMTATAVNAGDGATYQWYLNGTAISGATSSTYATDSLKNGDQVYCQVNCTSVCASPSVLFTSIKTFNVYPTGIHNGISFSGLQIVPNPNNGSFSITGMMSEKEGILQVRDMMGSIVLEKAIASSNGTINTAIELPATLSNGMYMIQLSSGNQKQVTRITLQR